MKTNGTDDRVLVTYDSRLGSTAEVTAFVGRVLSDEGASVDVVPIDRVTDLRSYTRVVIGSAIRYDRWLPEATEFVTANRQALGEVPVAIFFTCLALATRTPEGERKADGYAERLRRLLPETSDVQVGRFAGVLDPLRGPWWTRLLLRVLARVNGVAPGDYRDWAMIRAWGQALVAQSNPMARAS